MHVSSLYFNKNIKNIEGNEMTRKAKDKAKTGTYFVMHLGVAIAVAFAITGDWRAALAIGMLEPLVQTFAYYFHEKAWRGVPVRSS